MSAEVDITTFSDGEDIIIEVFAKDDEGNALTDTGNETIRLNVARNKTAAPVLSVDTSPQVVLTNAGTAHWTITLDAVNDLLNVIEPGRAYVFSIWSINGSTGRTYHQAEGRLVYQPSVGPYT